MIVLDTHVLVWWVTDPPSLSRKARRAVAGADRLGLPTIVFWEISLLVRKRKLDLGMSVAAVSNQLRKMTDLGFLARSGRGTFVFYRVVDSCVGELLHRGYCLARDGKAGRRRK